MNGLDFFSCFVWIKKKKVFNEKDHDIDFYLKMQTMWKEDCVRVCWYGILSDNSLMVIRIRQRKIYKY